jgi:4'-phosphopantetheinyl transferase
VTKSTALCTIGSVWWPAHVPADDEVQIVRFALDEDGDGRAFLPVLDLDELKRAASFKFDRDRRRFTVAHGLTRMVLGSILGIPAARVRFRREPEGKPQLDDDGCDVRFNLSHSGERAVLAVTSGREVGIDLEQEHPLEVLAFARLFFSPGERLALEITPPAERLGAFFKVWTRKESFIKAIGSGLSFPLAGFHVSLDDDADQLLLDCRAAPWELHRWTMTNVPWDPGYAAAITVEGADWQPTYRTSFTADARDAERVMR